MTIAASLEAGEPMNKRILLAEIALRCGLGRLARQANCRLLYVFNYHRISTACGAPDTLFDEGVFGQTQDALRRSVEYLARYTTVLSEADLVRAMENGPTGKGPYSMITFDDVYIDNFELAMPVLNQAGVPAIFFAPALLVENRNLGWWDQIAFVIKNSKKPRIEYRGETFDLEADRPGVISHFLTLMKTAPKQRTANLVAELATAADSPPPSKALMDKELMTWEQLRQAYDSGIAIGSHTCNHWVLSTLSNVDQAEEIIKSKVIIENRLGQQVRSIAYPVGGLRHINKATLDLAQDAGYKLAFTYNTGVSKVCDLKRFEIPRLDSGDDLNYIRAAIHFPKLMDYSAKSRQEYQSTNRKNDCKH